MEEELCEVDMSKMDEAKGRSEEERGGAEEEDEKVRGAGEGPLSTLGSHDMIPRV